MPIRRPRPPCRKCRTNPCVRRRHFCDACLAEEPVTAEESHTHAGVNFGQERRCHECGGRFESELFRRFDVTRLKFRDTCATCAYDSHPDSLSPYQRALVQVEREAGISHEVWMRQSASLWNRRHYELMAQFAGVTLLPGLRPVEKLYAYRAAALPVPEPACPSTPTGPTTSPRPSDGSAAHSGCLPSSSSAFSSPAAANAAA